MDPNPKTFPVLSYVMGRIPSFGPKPTAPAGADTEFFQIAIDQPSPAPAGAQFDPSSSAAGGGQYQIVDHMPRLTDPKVIEAMTRAVADVAQTRSILKTIGDRPDHEAVDVAKAKVADIEASLAKQLEELVLSPRPEEVDRFQWRTRLADKEGELRQAAEKERQTYKAIVQLDEMHEAYEKLLKDANVNW